MFQFWSFQNYGQMKNYKKICEFLRDEVLFIESMIKSM